MRRVYIIIDLSASTKDAVDCCFSSRENAEKAIKNMVKSGNYKESDLLIEEAKIDAYFLK